MGEEFLPLFQLKAYGKIDKNASMNEVNWRGMATLFIKETRRFLKVLIQTVLTPVITAVLYLLVFNQILQGRVQPYPGISYGAFLVPGLIMMAVLQNSFANCSSSILQSKMTGNMVFVLLAPISSVEFYFAFICAAIIRGLVVGLGVWIVSILLVAVPLTHPFWILWFAIIGGVILGGLGLIAGVWADNFDHLAVFQNFVVLPLSFLSGVFYSLDDLPLIWKYASAFNPFVYLMDGFRYGFLGISATNLWLAAGISLLIALTVSIIALYILNKGYKLRN